MEQAVFVFDLEGDPVSCALYGHGHINRTYLVETNVGHRYILQRLSRAAFKDIPGLMENVAAVTSYLSARTDDPRGSLHLIPTKEGSKYYLDEAGEYWRVYDFVEDSVCLQAARNEEDFYQSAVAFGRFQNQLHGFPADSLHETIEKFHNTPHRYAQLKDVLARDPLGRLAKVREEVAFALAREEEGGALMEMLARGELPLRVTHNDTKLNNVMLDAATGEALCIIDLDTVMPGLVAFDFGDSIRFGAATAPEDEKDLSKMEMSLSLYETFVRGFVPACENLTPAEIRSLPLGAKLMTLECGIRFLMDYVDGDHYFSIARPEHNLDRARTQFKLVADMEKKWDKMCSITEAYLS